MLAPHGLEELGHKLNAMTRQGRWTEMAKEVPDDVVHLFAAVGRYDQIVKPASSLTRNRQVAAISSTLPCRPSGTPAAFGR